MKFSLGKKMLAFLHNDSDTTKKWKLLKGPSGSDGSKSAASRSPGIDRTACRTLQPAGCIQTPDGALIQPQLCLPASLQDSGNQE